MQCLACGKETPNKFCHECLIIKSKKGFTDEELIQFKNLKECFIHDISEINNKLFQKNTKIKFNCISCGKEYVGTYKTVKLKDSLLCHQCTIEANNLEKYGVKNVFQLDKTKDKIKDTVKTRYGVDCYLQTETARENRKKVDENFLINHTHLVLDKYCSSIVFSSNKRRSKDDDGVLHYQIIECTCNKCSSKYETNARRLQRCPKCFPEDWLNGTSKIEKSIFEYIKNNCNHTVIPNARGVIPNKELDVYIPDLKLAFEFDGDYWHGCNTTDMSIFNDIKKHSGDKQRLCFERGIRLITIKECDFLNKKDVFYKFIDNAIKPHTKVFARKCDLRIIDIQTARTFCETYHVNGYRNGSIRYGLFYKDELLCVAVFGKHPKHKFECIRLCYKTCYDIIGGWDKIIKHFGKPFLHYINLMYFMGENKTGIGFRFVKDGLVLSRNTLQKNTQLYKYCKNITPGMSDIQNCINNGFTAIFDCGNDIRFYNTETLTM